MVRILVAFAAWAAGTVIAVGVTWFGANVVVSNAGVGPGMPVINATAQPASASPAVSVTPPGLPTATPAASPPASATPSAPATSAPATSATAAPPASGSQPAGTLRTYTLTGGRITLLVTQTSVQLVTAVPDAGYAVQTWSGTDWLRVDFSSGAQASSLIASWYQHQPTFTVTN
jgi:hypothetical protein